MKKELFEELCISDVIKNEATELEKLIQLDIQNVNNINKNIIIGNIKASLFGEVYNINYNVFKIDSVKDFTQELYSQLKPITKNTKKEINFFFLQVNGIFNNEFFYGEISHELVYVYQYIMSKRSVLDNIKIDKLYSIINQVKSENNYLQGIFADAIYACFDFEQDALIHELYGQIIHENLRHIDQNSPYILESNTYAFIKDIEFAIENIEDLDINLFWVLGSHIKALALFKKKLNRFKNKIGKMLIKVKKDLNENLEYLDNEVF